MDRAYFLMRARQCAPARGRARTPLDGTLRAMRLFARRCAMLVPLVLWAAAPIATATDELATQQIRPIDLSEPSPIERFASDAWAAQHADDIVLRGSGGDMALLGTVRAGALILTRGHASAQPSAKILNAAGDAVLLDTTDIGMGFATGLDLTLLTAISQNNELEIRFFGIDGWNSSGSAADPGGVRFDGFGVLMPVVPSQRIDYASRLYNIEVNLRPRVANGIPLILGFRSLQLHERMDLWATDPTPPMLDLRTRTSNFLYGVQIGAEPYLLGADGPLRLDGLAKAGIYGDHSSQGTFSPASGTIHAHDDRVSFVGELGVSVVYRFCQMFAFRAGYELLWVSGVALAPDQNRSTDLTVPTARVNNSATAFYQGAAVSLEFIF